MSIEILVLAKVKSLLIMPFPPLFLNYSDLYPVLVKMIPSLSHLVKSSEENKSIYNLSIERATAMVTLLSQITQTAGCRAELQAQLRRYYGCLLPCLRNTLTLDPQDLFGNLYSFLAKRTHCCPIW